MRRPPERRRLPRVPGWALPLAVLGAVVAWQWSDSRAAISRPLPPDAAPERSATAHAERGGRGHEAVPDPYRQMPNPEPALPEVIALGQKAYQTYCWVCHGRGAQGNGPAAPGLEPRPYDLTSREVQNEPDGVLFYRISEGVKDTAMPAWKHSLDDKTRWAIVRYLRGVAAARAPPAQPSPGQSSRPRRGAASP